MDSRPLYPASCRSSPRTAASAGHGRLWARRTASHMVISWPSWAVADDEQRAARRDRCREPAEQRLARCRRVYVVGGDQVEVFLGGRPMVRSAGSQSIRLVMPAPRVSVCSRARRSAVVAMWPSQNALPNASDTTVPFRGSQAVATVARHQFAETRFGLGRERVPVGGYRLSGLLGNQVGDVARDPPPGRFGPAGRVGGDVLTDPDGCSAGRSPSAARKPARATIRDRRPAPRGRPPCRRSAVLPRGGLRRSPGTPPRRPPR